MFLILSATALVLGVAFWVHFGMVGEELAMALDVVVEMVVVDIVVVEMVVVGLSQQIDS